LFDLKSNPDELAAVLHELRLLRSDLFSELAALRRLLEAGRGPRDEADRELLVVLAHSSRGAVFTTADVMERAKLKPEVAVALEAADIVNSIALGRLLARCAGTSLDGAMLIRIDRGRGGLLWQFIPQGLQE
jgi:hypothetical protein